MSGMEGIPGVHDREDVNKLAMSRPPSKFGCDKRVRGRVALSRPA